MIRILFLIIFLTFNVNAQANRNVTFDFQSISIPNALQLLADYKGENIVVAPDVGGDITMKLHNVSWDDAFDYVMRVGNLDADFASDAIFITRIGSDYSTAPSKSLSEPKSPTIYPLTLFKLDNIQPSLIADIFAVYQDELLTASNETSSIVAHLPPTRVTELRHLIESLDVVKSQLLIEARIVEVNRDYSSALGVNWGASSLIGSGVSLTASSILQGASSSSVGLGYVSSKFILDANLAAMEYKGKGTIVSSPKVFVFDRKTAKISKGFEIPYQETQGDGVITTSFKDASLSLEVTPIINGNEVMMDISLFKNEPDFSKAIAGQPPISTSSFTSSVNLRSGDTVALGGVFSRSSSSANNDIPFLSSIPYLGRLFGSTSNKELDSELLLFLTATLVDDRSPVVGFDFSRYLLPVSINDIDTDLYLNNFTTHF